MPVKRGTEWELSRKYLNTQSLQEAEDIKIRMAEKHISCDGVHKPKRC